MKKITADKKSINRAAKKDLPVKSFATSKAFETWLAKNHNNSSGLWIKFYKKSSGVATVTYQQALETALCYGWIDSQANSVDEESYIQRYTPRKPKSIWSKRNKLLFARLKKEGRMKPAGLKEVALAQADGRWTQAYDSFAKMKIPDDFLEELSKNKEASAFFNTLNKTNLYSIGWRLQTAKKPEIREKRKKTILEMLANGKKFH
jgi:uncharacterized protein YdeI (YjbR/CyaY-like superfamily)